ncbi:MAG: hypothetical protein ACRDLZ_03555 [Gaiellaceae bacterium]
MADRVAELIERLQQGTRERERLKRRRASSAELDARERALERLRWQLAAVARRTAYDDLGNAA